MKLYNSCTKTKEIFKPNTPGRVLMYVCGITPYDVTHLGHAATYVFFDVLGRYLRFKGYEVEYTQNVTDIDDDILKRAKAVGQDWKSMGRHWTKYFLDDLKRLNVVLPNHYVLATDYIDEIIEIVSRLEKKGFAYLKEGYVYFDVKKFKSYGQLSHYNREQMLCLSKERGANPDDPLKRDPLDFLLWQKSIENEPSWKSPWGSGRPGWHIECSAMIHGTLGQRIDIHGGGLDLIYPHHESEIAQSESYTGKSPFVKYWLHTAMVMHLGEKMSKSLGNLVLVRDLLKTCSADTIRFMLLSYHYRQPWEFDEKQLEWAAKQVKLIQISLGKNLNSGESKERLELKKFASLMDDDINTPQALAFMISLAQKIAKEEDKMKKADLQRSLGLIWKILGFTV